MLHKAQKLLMVRSRFTAELTRQLETDSPETVNECIKSVRKMGRVGVIAACTSSRCCPVLTRQTRLCAISSSSASQLSPRVVTHSRRSPHGEGRSLHRQRPGAGPSVCVGDLFSSLIGQTGKRSSRSAALLCQTQLTWQRIQDGSFSAQFMVSHRVPIECVALAVDGLTPQRLPGPLRGLPGARRGRREGLRRDAVQLAGGQGLSADDARRRLAAEVIASPSIPACRLHPAALMRRLYKQPLQCPSLPRNGAPSRTRTARASPRPIARVPIPIAAAATVGEASSGARRRARGANVAARQEGEVEVVAHDEADVLERPRRRPAQLAGRLAELAREDEADVARRVAVLSIVVCAISRADGRPGAQKTWRSE